MATVKIAMIGVGAISGIYLKNLTNMFKEVELIGVCDLIRERAEKAQEEYKVPKLYETMEEAFADPEVDIILNLTRPYEHFDVSSKALLAGKHVYSEKPLGATFEEGVELVKIAEEKGLMLGGAPDTYLGAGMQTCKKLIEDGYIGDIIGSACFMICHGHETWHPDPAFYYQFGGGPMMDMGPYYVTTLVNLLGPVAGVMGATKKSFDQRIITSKEHYGEVVDVDVSTHLTGTLYYESGAIGTIITTFDVYNKGQARFEIYGTKGTMIVPDPNHFDGPIKILRPEDGEFKEMPLLFDYRENSRGLGIADMAKALQTGRAYRANYKQTLHVLEILTSFDKSSEKKEYLPLTTTYVPEAPMKNNPAKGILD
ncbi:MAG: Gfo/Idh/MocA family oxidoreductase [Lachnospiraceae bacterium]